jgi:hypothetical protein
MVAMMRFFEERVKESWLADEEQRREFARRQREELLRMGFSCRDASRLIAAAGPGRAVAAAYWALEVTGAAPLGSPETDSLLWVLDGMLQSSRGGGWLRKLDALAHLGYVVPCAEARVSSAHALRRFLKGARAAVVSRSWREVCERYVERR